MSFKEPEWQRPILLSLMLTFELTLRCLTDLSQLSSWSFLCCSATATASCLSASVWHLTAPAPAATRSVVCLPCSRHRPPDTLCTLWPLVTLVTPPWECTSTTSLWGGSAHVQESRHEAWPLSLGRSLGDRVLWHLNFIMKSTQLSLTFRQSAIQNSKGRSQRLDSLTTELLYNGWWY